MLTTFADTRRRTGKLLTELKLWDVGVLVGSSGKTMIQNEDSI